MAARRPEIEKCFGMEPGPGILEILDGKCDPVEAVRMTTVPHLNVLGPGLDHRELGGRLASREMLQILEWAENEFDHVIIDSPPSLLISDAKLVAPVSSPDSIEPASASVRSQDQAPNGVVGTP